MSEKQIIKLMFFQALDNLWEFLTCRDKTVVSILDYLILISPAFFFCSVFNCVSEKQVVGLVSRCCSGSMTHEPSVWGCKSLETHCPSTVPGKSLPEEKALEQGVWLPTSATCTFCCTWENATKDCMALLKVSWCWTSWRTHLDRPGRQTQHRQTLVKFLQWITIAI